MMCLKLALIIIMLWLWLKSTEQSTQICALTIIEYFVKNEVPVTMCESFW